MNGYFTLPVHFLSLLSLHINSFKNYFKIFLKITLLHCNLEIFLIVSFCCSLSVFYLFMISFIISFINNNSSS